VCGINGLIGFSDSRQLIEAMNKAIAHRGPDAEGLWQDNNIALGHRRLSIIDLSAKANQPFIKRNLVVVYNGEIYNFPELKKDLKSRGVEFTTDSDTEVLLELFRVYREDSFNKLIGMFSFCIYDTMKKDLFLVRDYFGIKPLYYYLEGKKRLAFSSELKALLNISDIGKALDPEALVSCVNYLWVAGDNSIFKDIKKVPPAHYMYVSLNKGIEEVQIKRYWELKAEQISLSDVQITEMLRDAIEKSVKRHLISDVPVGAFLSGGVDSSLISALAKRFNKDISTYTISIRSKDKKIERMPDDNIYARELADTLKLDHSDIQVDADILKYLEPIIYSLDEPIGDPAAINTYLICKAARDRGIKVLLSGMGADELFAGYRRQYATLLANRINRIPATLKKSLKAIISPLPVRIGSHGIRQLRWLKRFISFMDMPLDAAYMRSYSYYDRGQLFKLFKDDFRPSIDRLYERHRDIFYSADGYDDINRMCNTDISMFMQGLNLAYTDKASMAASVEVRVPFIDKEVVTLAMSIRGNMKIRNRTSKYILKKVASAYIPEKFAYRPKASFGMPIRAWVSRDLRGLTDELLSEKNIKKRGVFNPDFVKRIIDNDRRGIEDNAYRIYQFLTVELWMRRYVDR